MQLFQCLTIAAILHALIWYITPSERLQLRSELPIEVAYIESDSQNRPSQDKMIVDPQLQKLQEKVDDLKKKARFLADKTTRTKVEQALQGPNAINQQLRKPEKQQQKPQAQKSDPWAPPGLDSAPALAREELQKGATKKANSDDFTINVGSEVMQKFLPEVKSGSFTSLNADQFLFYTFHARTSQQIGNRWTENLRYLLNRMPTSEYDRVARGSNITEFEVLMTPEGKFVKVLYHRRSQSEELDEAAVLAIVRASPFVNPPEEMVQDDGYIHLNYSFRVHLKPRSWANK